MKRNNPNGSEVTGSQERGAEGKGRPTGLPLLASFDGCGINLDGRRILTGSRADWDTDTFKQFCFVAVMAWEQFRAAP